MRQKTHKTQHSVTQHNEIHIKPRDPRQRHNTKRAAKIHIVIDLCGFWILAGLSMAIVVLIALAIAGCILLAGLVYLQK